MGQTLEHGIFLPDEGERNCYSGLAENWVALDTLVGAYSSHYQNTTIHVTASDKQTWNGKQDALSQTQLDAVNSGIDSSKVQQIATNTSDISSLQSGKANDSDVVHKSGDETIDGNKTFNGNTNCVGELNQTAPFKMTADTSFATGSKNTSIYDQNGFQCANDQITYNNSRNIRRTWTVNNNGSGTTVSAGFNFILSTSGQKVFYPISDSDTDNGASTAYWKNTYTKKINNLEPSSLSLPGYTSPRIDISSYITNLTGGNNNYTVPANGYIFVRTSNGTYLKLLEYPSGVCSSVCSQTADDIGTFLPVIKDRTCIIIIKCSSVNRAYFIPCLGNV